MPALTVQVVFQGKSMLPKDRYVTNFHFNREVLPAMTFEEAAADAIAQLKTFYETATVVNVNAVGWHIPFHVLRPYELRAYDLTKPKNERFPFRINGTLPTNTAALGALPSEVGCVLSFVSGEPPYAPGDKGRVYIGPLIDQCSTGTGAGTNVPRVATLFSSILRAAAIRLMDSETPGPVRWCTRSTVVNKVERGTPLFQTVTGGWTDDALDTQRRRGEAATAKTPWGVYAA